MSIADTYQPPVVTFLLVDDHEMYRAGMRRLIETQQGWRVVAEASAAEEAVQLASELRPAVAIVDLRLREGDGLDAVRQMHDADPAVRILVTSAHDEKLYAAKCLQAGASGYVEKGAPAAVLRDAVEKTLAGGIHLSQEMTQQMLARNAGRRRTIANPLETLTPRECEVYSLVGAGINVKQIAGELNLSPKTVEYHRQQLKKKLQLTSSAALARHAMANPLDNDAVTPSARALFSGSPTDA